MVSDQIQWITNFRCPDNTKASARDYSLLSPTVHRAEAPQTGYPKQLMDPVEQQTIMQAEVTSGDQTVHALLPQNMGS